MNLSNENIKPSNKSDVRLKHILVILFSLISILLVLALLIWIYSQKLITGKLKLTIDGTSKTVDEGLFDIENGEVYTSINKIANLVGYQEYPGQYKQYVEGDITNCYVTNSKEVATFSSGSSKINKYELLSSDSEAQVFDVGNQVITKGNSLYVNEEGLKRAFNLIIQYNAKQNLIEIATLPYLVTTYSKLIPAAVLQGQVSDAVTFSDQKALLYNMVVIKDSSTGLLGVSKLDNQDIQGVTSMSNLNSLIISTRYKEIEFIEGVNNFIVTTSEGKVGILGSDGVTKVKPAYDAIKEIDKENGLYLVVSNSKQGVINQNGKIIVYLDYEQIGLDNNITDSNVTNRYLLYGNCIPVKLNGKWGMFDKSGNKILSLEYDAIGSQTSNSSDKTSTGIVLIPDINAIIVAKDLTVENAKVRKYGLVNAQGQLMIQVALENAYKTTISNTTTYYMTYQNVAYNIVEYWKQQNSATSTTTTNTANTTNIANTVNTTNSTTETNAVTVSNDVNSNVINNVNQANGNNL